MTRVYCGQSIDPGDDGQRITHGTFAHTMCAWAADEAFWAQFAVEVEEVADASQHS